MAWIESHQSLREHPKTYALMDALKVSRRDAVGTLHLLWWWCLDYAADGLIKQPASVLARAVDWVGDPSSLISGLIAAGFLAKKKTGLEIHDWREFRLHFDASMERKERKLEQVRQRVQAYRDRLRICNAPVTQSNAAKEPNRNNQTNITKPTQPTEQGRSRPVDESLELIWNIKGAHYGKRIQDLDPEYCSWALDGLDNIGDGYRRGLTARIAQKKAESFGMSKNPIIRSIGE